jgi:hypothetical protein
MTTITDMFARRKPSDVFAPRRDYARAALCVKFARGALVMLDPCVCVRGVDKAPYRTF